MKILRATKLDLLALVLIIGGGAVFQYSSFPAVTEARELIQSTSKPYVHLVRNHLYWVEWNWRMKGYKLPVAVTKRLDTAKTPKEAITAAIEILYGHMTPVINTSNAAYYPTFAEAWALGTGDCDEYALMWYTMLSSLGLDVAVVDANLSQDPDNAHTVAMVKVEGEIFVLDESNLEVGNLRLLPLSSWISGNNPEILYASHGLKTQFAKSWLGL